MGGVLYYSIRSICHFAVPIFFMITGTLFLNPDHDLPLKKNLEYVKKYALVILIFGWGFAFAEVLFTEHKVSLSAVGTSFLYMLQGKSWNHMWYLYELLGLTIALPIIRGIAHMMRKKEMEKYILLILFFFLSVVTFVERVIGFEFGVKFPISSVYVFYMLFGWYLSSHEIHVKKIYCIIAVVIACSLCVVDGYTYIFNKPMIGFASYETPVIVLFSTSVFLLFKKAGFKGGKTIDKVVQTLSTHSFAIYIMHMFWINVAYKALHLNPFKLNPVLGMVATWMMVTIASYITAVILKRFPFIKKIV